MSESVDVNLQETLHQWFATNSDAKCFNNPMPTDVCDVSAGRGCIAILRRVYILLGRHLKSLPTSKTWIRRPQNLLGTVRPNNSRVRHAVEFLLQGHDSPFLHACRTRRCAACTLCVVTPLSSWVVDTVKMFRTSGHAEPMLAARSFAFFVNHQNKTHSLS